MGVSIAPAPLVPLPVGRNQHAVAMLLPPCEAAGVAGPIVEEVDAYAVGVAVGPLALVPATECIGVGAPARALAVGPLAFVTCAFQ